MKPHAMPRARLALTAGLLLLLACTTALTVAPPALRPSAYLFLSPCRDEGLSWHHAAARLRTAEHARSRQLLGFMLVELGVQPVAIHDAVGDWADGAENSLLVELPGDCSPDALRCAGAWFGLVARQKAVLAFRPEPGGAAEAHVLRLPAHGPLRARELLDAHGVLARTLLHCHQGGAVVVVVTPSAAEGRALRRVAALARGTVRTQAGRVEVIAGPTRDKASEHFAAVVRAYRGSVELAKAP